MSVPPCEVIGRGAAQCHPDHRIVRVENLKLIEQVFRFPARFLSREDRAVTFLGTGRGSHELDHSLMWNPHRALSQAAPQKRRRDLLLARKS